MSTCPYCGAVFSPPPKRKKVCVQCGQTCYIRSNQKIFNSDLLTEDQMLASDFYSDLIGYGASVDDYERAENILAKRWGLKPNPYDVVWGVSNQLISSTKGLQASNQEYAILEMLQRAKMVTFSQAVYQAKRGYDPGGYLSSVTNYEIQIQKHSWAAVGVKISEYKIETSNCCEACNKYQGKIYKMEYLEKNIILPIKECTYMFDKNLKYGWCTCTYRAFISKRRRD